MESAGVRMSQLPIALANLTRVLLAQVDTAIMGSMLVMSYFPATADVAEAFGYGFTADWTSCGKNKIVSGSYISPLSCPKHERHCKNGFCNWLTQQDAWNNMNCGVQVCCTALVRCINMEESWTVKTTTESNYVVTPLPPIEPEIIAKLPSGSKKIYQGEGWRYFKIPIPSGNFYITGKVLADVCKNYEMETPCPTRKHYYKQKLCIETAHTAHYRVGNFIDLQTAITEKGYKTKDADHLEYTFVYDLPKEDDEIDGACGYWPGYYCHQGKTTLSDGVNKFSLCALSI